MHEIVEESSRAKFAQSLYGRSVIARELGMDGESGWQTWQGRLRGKCVYKYERLHLERLRQVRDQHENGGGAIS